MPSDSLNEFKKQNSMLVAQTHAKHICRNFLIDHQFSLFFVEWIQISFVVNCAHQKNMKKIHTKDFNVTIWNEGRSSFLTFQ